MLDSGLMAQMQNQEIRRQTIRERLIARQRNAERELKEIEEAIKALDENPGFEKVHDMITRIGY